MLGKGVVKVIFIIVLLTGACAGFTSGEVAARRADGDFVLAGEWAVEGTKIGDFAGLRCIAVAPYGYVYVTDELNDRVQYFTREGSFRGMWGQRGSAPGEFIDPHGIAVGPNGDVYVVDSGNFRVQRFSATGIFLDSWSGGPGPGEYTTPTDVAVAPDGTVYGVCPTHIRYFTADGSLKGIWDITPYADNELKCFALAVGVGRDGTVYVTEAYGGHVLCFSRTGSFLAKWGVKGFGPGELTEPNGIAVGPGDSVYVLSSGLRKEKITHFGADGSFLGEWWPKAEEGSRFGNIGRVGLAVGPDGTLYIADQGRGVVQYYRPVVKTDG
jgi:tripartite motif-containing protein 71